MRGRPRGNDNRATTGLRDAAYAARPVVEPLARYDAGQEDAAAGEGGDAGDGGDAGGDMGDGGGDFGGSDFGGGDLGGGGFGDFGF